MMGGDAYPKLGQARKGSPFFLRMENLTEQQDNWLAKRFHARTREQTETISKQRNGTPTKIYDMDGNACLQLVRNVLCLAMAW